MILQRLRLYHFRVYQEQEFHPSPGLNLITGVNGAGKTAILEGLHLLSAARSFRAGKEGEFCRWGTTESLVEGHFETHQHAPRTLSLSWRRQSGEWKKQATFQGDSVARLADFLGCVPLSLFTPSDLELVNGSPSVRRRYLDLMLSKMSPLHLLELARLKKVLTSRNLLLKQNRPRKETRPWDRLLFDLSTTVSRRRQNLVEELAATSGEFHRRLTDSEPHLSMSYKRCWPEEWPKFEAKLDEVHQREKLRGATLYSPQKDELEITCHNRSVRIYGSQGEQRLVALALRLAEARLLAQHKDEKSILLLDDAFSELDPDRKKRLIHLLPEFSQVFLTSATPLDLSDLNHRQHRVSEGQIHTLSKTVDQ